MMLRIRIGGTTINGRPRDGEDPRGLFVARDGFEGWDDGGGTARSESDPRPAAHGSFDAPAYLGPRVCSIDGWALAGTEYELAHLRSVIMGTFADGQMKRVQVDHQGQTLWADARRSGSATFRDAGERGGLLRARFVLPFICPDPRKYGTVRRFGPGTVIPINHVGNFPALPKFRVRGAWPAGYTIGGPGGERFVVTAPLSMGNEHIVDFATCRVTRGGLVQVGAVSIPETWTVPGGVTVTCTLTGQGSGDMDVDVPETYV